MNKDCTCEICRNACKYRAGWFLPSEILKLSRYFNDSLKNIFNKYLAVDWWLSEILLKNTVFLLAPVLKETNPGEEYPADPRGECIFYNEKGLCDIHKVKPYECKMMFHGKDTSINHLRIAQTWNNNKNQNLIIHLLERKPEVKFFSL